MVAQRSDGGGRAGRARRRSSEQVRGLILTAARELFEAEGYGGASTRAIAERAGVSTTVLFRHYGSKRALYDRVMGREPAAEPGARLPDRDEERTRELLLDAARQLFSAQGYARTGTRQIADRAGVAEAALLRCFGTKATLFRHSILNPFGDFIHRRRAGTAAAEEPAVAGLASPEFLGGLYRTLLEQSDALLALVAARVHEGGDVLAVSDQQDAMDEIIRPLVAQVGRDCEAAGVTGINVAVATRITVAMIGGTAIFKDWLFADADGITSEEIVTEMVAYVSSALAR